MARRVAPNSLVTIYASQVALPAYGRIDGDLVGATVTHNLYDYTGALVDTSPMAALAGSSDWFAVILTPGPVGRYREEVVIEYSGTVETLERAFVVSTTPHIGLRLGDLRRVIAQRLQGFKEIRITQDALDATTFVDAMQLRDTDHYRSWEMVVTHSVASNMGQRARVVGSSYDSGTITFTPELPAPLKRGDRVQLFNTQGELSVTIQDIDDAINAAIQEAHPASTIPIVQHVDAQFVFPGTGQLQIPEHMTHISGVEVLFNNEVWVPVPEPSWTADFGNPMVRLGQNVLGGASGYAVRLIGYERHDILEHDDDETSVDQMWLVNHVLGQLQMAASTRRASGSSYPMSAGAQNRADSLFGRVGASRMPNTVQVRP